MRRFAVYVLPLLAYAGLIFYGSTLSTVPSVGISQGDKLAHLAEYGIFGALLARALCGYGLQPRRALLIGTLLGGLYGVTDEYHQRFTPGRTPDPKDAAADLAGSALGATVWSLRAARRRR